MLPGRRFLSTVLLGISLCTAAQAAQSGVAESDWPVAEFTPPEAVASESPERRRRGAHHDGQGLVSTASETSFEAFVSDRWWAPLRALPVPESDAIVVGEVTDAQAYLSNDRSAVYSEFTFRVDDVLKSDDPAVGKRLFVVADRMGGNVRFPNGTTQTLLFAEMGLPRIGRRYLVFLARYTESPDYTILTGCELREGRVALLDTNTTLRSATYDGTSEERLIEEVRDMAERPFAYEVAERVKVTRAPSAGRGRIVVGPLATGTEVRIDGKAVGTASADGEIVRADVSPGNHDVTVDHARSITQSRTFRVGREETVEWRPAFSAATAIVVTTEPNAEVYVDGKLVGRTSPTGRLRATGMNAGKHVVRVVKDGFEPASHAVTVVFLKPAELSIELESAALRRE